MSAEAIEVPVWQELVKVLGNPAQLEELASEWLGMTVGNSTASIERVAELDRQIDAQRKAISAVMAMAAKEAIARGEDAPEDYIHEATKTLTDELAQLQGMRKEAADWLAEQEDADRRAKDLKALARMAHDHLGSMTLQEQSEFAELIDLKVYLEGPAGMGKGGAPCSIRGWYTSMQRDIPAEGLTDDQWELIAPLLSGGRPAILRRTIDALLYKARTGEPWHAVRAACGATQTTANYHFKRWSADGTWARIDSLLTDVPRVPVPVGVASPPMRIEGKIDPRLMLLPGERSGRGW